MDDDFLAYLYVTGELDKEDSLANNDIKELYDIYNSMFPDYPIDNQFFFKSHYDQKRILTDAINNNEPISGRKR